MQRCGERLSSEDGETWALGSTAVVGSVSRRWASHGRALDVFIHTDTHTTHVDTLRPSSSSSPPPLLDTGGFGATTRDSVQLWLWTARDTAVMSSRARFASPAAAAMCIIACRPSLISDADFSALRSPEWPAR
jgi:hypothetical protein